jgi:type II secretion system protein L
LKSLGISITRNALSAFLWEQSLLSSRIEGACTVTCGEPYGGQDDIARLAEEVRKIAGSEKIPPAVISLPPAWTYVRRVSLPVGDLSRAKKMHIAELEGNLPIEEEEILSDILPSPAGETGTFLAIAAKRSAVEKTVAAFSDAGFRLDRTITDHVSLLCAVLASKNGFSGLVFSDRNDLLALRILGGTITSVRQFPETIAEDTGALRDGMREIAGTGGLVVPSQSCVVFGDLPHPLTDVLPQTDAFVMPAGAGDASPLAYGAAISPFYGKETGGFSLRTSAEAESERTRQQSRIRIAAVAAAVALLAASASLGVARWAEAKKVSRIRAVIRKEFSEAVPGAKGNIQGMAQIQEKIRSFSRQSKELGSDVPGATFMLGKASRALPADGTISVREVSFDSGRLRIAGDAASAQNVEMYRTALVEAFGPETNVTVKEAEGSAQGGKVRYTILLEKGTDGRAS